MKLFFVTVNKYKIEEVKQYLEGSGLELVPINIRIQEILETDLEKVAKAKALSAFKALHRPCVVEHGALCIDVLNGLPEGLSKPVWDTVKDRLCTFLQPEDSRAAKAKTVVAYCDGKTIRTFCGITEGSVAEKARGAYEFQWDPIFVPDGASETFGEMGFPKKAKFSQSRKAWDALIDELT